MLSRPDQRHILPFHAVIGPVGKHRDIHLHVLLGSYCMYVLCPFLPLCPTIAACHLPSSPGLLCGSKYLLDTSHSCQIEYKKLPTQARKAFLEGHDSGTEYRTCSHNSPTFGNLDILMGRPRRRYPPFSGFLTHFWWYCRHISKFQFDQGSMITYLVDNSL